MCCVKTDCVGGTIAPSPVFHVDVKGEIQSASFLSSVYSCVVKYSIVSPLPSSWRVVAGEPTGISQKSNSRHYDVVWNVPVDCGFAADSPLGWPRLCLTVVGKDWVGNEILVGYGSVLIPPQSGTHERTIPLYCPVTTSGALSWLKSIFGSLNIFSPSTAPQLINPEEFMTSVGPSREFVRMANSGASVTVSVNVLVRDFEKLNLVF